MITEQKLCSVRNDCLTDENNLCNYEASKPLFLMKRKHNYLIEKTNKKRKTQLLKNIMMASHCNKI